MPAKKYSCEHCGKTCSRLSNLHRHQRSTHRSDFFCCYTCGRCLLGETITYVTREITQKIQIRNHGHLKKVTNSKNSDSDYWSIKKLEEEAIEWNSKKCFLEAPDKIKYDPLTFLKVKDETIWFILKKERIKRSILKLYLTLQVRFTKTKEDQVEIEEPHFHGLCHIVLSNENI